MMSRLQAHQQSHTRVGSLPDYLHEDDCRQTTTRHRQASRQTFFQIINRTRADHSGHAGWTFMIFYLLHSTRPSAFALMRRQLFLLLVACVSSLPLSSLIFVACKCMSHPSNTFQLTCATKKNRADQSL